MGCGAPERIGRNPLSLSRQPLSYVFRRRPLVVGGAQQPAIAGLLGSFMPGVGAEPG